MVIGRNEMDYAKGVSNVIVFIHEGMSGEHGAAEDKFNVPKTEEIIRVLNGINKE